MLADKIKENLEKYNNAYNSVVNSIHEKQDLAAKTEQEIAQLSAQANQLQGAIYGLNDLLNENSDETTEEVAQVENVTEVAPQN